MKKSFLLILIGIISLGLLFNSCDPTGPDPSDEVVEVNDNITTPTVWSGDKTYVINKSDFYVESDLTIEPGAIIKFSSSTKGLNILNESTAKGKIIAIGSATKPIIFTSYKDDNYGGDTNGDAEASMPAKGDWQNIDLNGTTESEFVYCKFLYGGAGIYASPTLNLSSDAAARIENCTFAHNGGGQNGNFFVGALNAEGADNTTVIKNNTFFNNTIPLTINAEIDIDNSNSFSSGASSNTHNAIFVSKDIQKNTTWAETEVAFVITSENMNVTVGNTLSLGNDVVLKFMNNGILNLSQGESSLANFDGAGVYYTSYKDDELKGDSNADGNNTAAASADWTGVFIDTWKSAGYAQWSNIRFNDPNPPVK
jgi:hypothetical protein